MADLIVKRAMAWRDLLRRYQIEIDGVCVGHIRAGGTTHVRIAEGIRKVCLSIDGYGTGEKTILASNQCVAILHCAPAELPVAADRTHASSPRLAKRLPADRTTYIEAKLESAEDLARAFLHAAWSVARYQIQERTKPGTRSRYGLTAGDISVLCHGCRIAGANIGTRLNSANYYLWNELARIGWLAAGPIPETQSREVVAYYLTELGQMELLEIFG
jgi:hypothetical protein